MSKFFFEDDIPDYCCRQFNALLALAGTRNVEIPTGNHACVSDVISLLEERRFGLSDSTLKRIGKLTTDAYEGFGEEANALLIIILAVIALQVIVMDEHGIWDCPRHVLEKIGETAAELEAAAASRSNNPIAAETHAEKVVAAAMTAKALGPKSMEDIVKGTPEWATGCADSIRSRLFKMILVDSFDGLEDVLESFEAIITSFLLSHVLLTNDFLARSEGATNRIGLIDTQLKEAVTAGTRDDLDKRNAEATAFIELAASREALRMAAESTKDPELAIANQAMNDFDFVLERGTEEHMRLATGRAAMVIESLATLTLASNTETSLEHIDEHLESALRKWKTDLRSSILADDVDTLEAKRQRFESLFGSLMSFEALCTAFELLKGEQGSEGDIDMPLDRLRTAIASGDAASADKGIKESYVLLNGSLYLNALDAIMSSEAEVGLAGLYKASLVGQYVDLKMAVKTSDCNEIERAIVAINKALNGSTPRAVNNRERIIESTRDSVDEEEGGNPLTALELVAAVTSAELELRRRMEEIERKTAVLMTFLETDEGKRLLVETAVMHAVFGGRGTNFLDSFSERLGLGKVSEW